MQPRFTALCITAFTLIAGAAAMIAPASALSTQDCKNVGGTVVEVADDRCGSSRQYCRMPDTNAVCIDVRNVQAAPGTLQQNPKLKDLPAIQQGGTKVQPNAMPKANIQGQ
ncbi:MAG TPA: hypothetical protein VNJ31_07475 [Methyloceanibacter sp.]|nr:hypothetical protein [Methyloceanibacter sp.]